MEIKNYGLPKVRLSLWHKWLILAIAALTWFPQKLCTASATWVELQTESKLSGVGAHLSLAT